MGEKMLGGSKKKKKEIQNGRGRGEIFYRERKVSVE